MRQTIDLIAYWRVLKSRAWLILLSLLAFGVSYLLVRPTPPSGYSAHMRFVVGVAPEEQPVGTYTYDRYYTWLTAEYLLDDLSEVVKSQRFAEDVGAAAGLPLPPHVIQGATSAGKLHRILDVSISWGDLAEIQKIADAAVTVLTTRGGEYFAQLGTEDAVITLIDPPAVAPIGSSLRQRLDLPLRLALALLVGIALAFLADHIDPTVRHRADALALGLPLIGQIPAKHSWWRWLPLHRRLP